MKRKAIKEFVGRREFLKNGLRLSGTLVGCAAIPTLLDGCSSPTTPDLVPTTPVHTDSSSASIVRSIVVKNAATGAYVSGASVSVDDGFVCWVPQLTDTSGEVTFTTTGLKNIWVRRSGYADYALAVSSSLLSYNVSITPLPSTPKLTILSSTLVDAARMVSLASTFGPVEYLGQYSLQQIDYGLAGITVAYAVCQIVFAGACTAATIPLAVVGTAQAVAVLLRVPETTEFDFYLMPGPSLLMLPAGT